MICIFFMLNVHVHPGAGHPSIVSQDGAFWLLGAVLSDTLGRASVAALSFVSGYLLWRKAAGRPFGVVARDKARSLLVPMVAWNLVFAGLLFGRFLVTSRHGDPGRDPSAAGADVLTLLTGLNGETANRSLFFLRDLFVASLMMHLLGPLLRRYPLPLLAAIAVLAVLGLGRPVIFRPSIMLFVAAGMVVAQRGWQLDTLFIPRRLPVLVLPFVAALVLTAVVGDGVVTKAAGDIFRRGALIGLVLTVAAVLVRRGESRAFVALEPYIFETYLAHATFIAILWGLWEALVGDEFAPSYVLFFLLAPVAAMVFGQGLGRVTDHLPAPLQLLTRGRVAGARSVAKDAVDAAAAKPAAAQR